MELNLILTHAVNDERIALDLKGINIRYVRTGIGKVKSAIRLSDAIHSEQPDLVLNIGTAGSLDHPVGDVFVCREFIDRDFRKVGLPGLDYRQNTDHLFDEKMSFIRFEPAGICNTGDSFLTEASDIEGDVFDMEAYAQALLCTEKKIPFLSVKYITDIIGQNSVKHWEDKLEDARKGLKEFIESRLFDLKPV